MRTAVQFVAYRIENCMTPSTPSCHKCRRDISCETPRVMPHCTSGCSLRWFHHRLVGIVGRIKITRFKLIRFKFFIAICINVYAAPLNFICMRGTTRRWLRGSCSLIFVQMLLSRSFAFKKKFSLSCVWCFFVQCS